MLGKQEKPIMHVKAAEARGLLEFTAVTLEKYEPQFAQGRDEHEQQNNTVHGQLLVGAAKAACSFEQILHDSKSNRNMHPDTIDALMLQYYRFVVLFHRIEDVPYHPKTHLMYHLVQYCRRHGHPLRYHAYSSESMNGVIARIASSCHRTTYAVSIFFKVHLSKLMEEEKKNKSR